MPPPWNGGLVAILSCMGGGKFPPGACPGGPLGNSLGNPGMGKCEWMGMPGRASTCVIGILGRASMCECGWLKGWAGAAPCMPGAAGHGLFCACMDGAGVCDACGGSEEGTCMGLKGGKACGAECGVACGAACGADGCRCCPTGGSVLEEIEGRLEAGVGCGGVLGCPAAVWLDVAGLTVFGAGFQTSPNEGGGNTSMLAGALEGAAGVLLGFVATWMDAGGGTYTCIAE